MSNNSESLIENSESEIKRAQDSIFPSDSDVDEVDELNDEKKRKKDVDGDDSEDDEDGKSEKPKKKFKATANEDSASVKKYFQDEAEESEDDGETAQKDKKSTSKGKDNDDDEEEDSEDENNYKFGDGFVVEDNFQSSDESDDEIKSRKPKKRELSRLKKRKDDFALDEDDLLLIEDNRMATIGLGGKTLQELDEDVIAPVRKSTAKRRLSDDGDDDIGEVDEEDEDLEEDEEVDDGRNFIVDEDGEGTDSSPRKKINAFDKIMPSRRYTSERMVDDGPSIDQIHDAREIFGDAFDFIDLDDEDQMEQPVKSTDEKQMLAFRRGYFDRHDLVANFCTARDDEIRSIDRPERYQNILVGRTIPSDHERKLESTWIANHLIKKLHEKEENQSFSASDFHETIYTALKFIQIDNLEIPFIFTYRRDYLHPAIESNHLWFILSYDEKWESLFSIKRTVLNTIGALQEAALKSQIDLESERRHYRNKVRFILDEIDKLTTAVKLASAEENDANEIIANNVEDSEETRNEDEHRLQQAMQRHADLIAQLKQKQLELSEARLEEDEMKRKADATVKYHPKVAEEVLRLFPRERYVPMIENAIEESSVRDILQFLELLIRGAQGLVIANKADDEDGSQFKTGFSQESEKSSKKPSLNKDKYSKLLQTAPALRQLIEFALPRISDIGDGMRHGINVEMPSCPNIRLDVKSLSFVQESDRNADLFGGSSSQLLLQSERQVIAAAELIIATELSREPSIRQSARELFKEYATISTRPTSKGLLAIHPFSELFGIHFIDNKPVSDIYRPGRHKDRTVFIRLMEAKSQGLITVTINHPRFSQLTSYSQSYESSNQSTSVNDKNEIFEFFMEKLNIRSLCQAVDIDVDPHILDSWDELRENAYKLAFSELLPTLLERELYSDLMRISREAIIEEAGENFAIRYLSVGPFRPLSDVRQDLSKLFLSCPRRSYYGSVMSVFVCGNDPLYMSFIDRNGVLRGYDLLPFKAFDNKRVKLKEFMLQYRPETIAINASGGLASKIIAQMIEKDLIRDVHQSIIEKRAESRQQRKRQLKESDDNSYDDDNMVEDEDEDEEDSEPYTAHVCVVMDDVAMIYLKSPRAKKQFPDLQPGAAASICLGRYVQEPLAELCNIFTLADATEVFGYEIINLNIHEHQSLLRGIRLPLIRELERRLVDAVNVVGVDINHAVQYDHLGALLAFVCGLGLRKADALRNAIRRSIPFVESRKDLLVNHLLGFIVYTNAIGFLRIQPENYDDDNEDLDDEEKPFIDHDDRNSNRRLNPLDNTRIHPECYITYDFVQKICADSLDRDFSPTDYYDVVNTVRKYSRSKLSVMVKSKWMDLWQDYCRPTQKTYEDDVISKQTSEIVKKSFPVELRDKLHVLDLDEYLEELEKRGKGKRRLQLEMIKEELRYPWLDLRVPMVVFPSTEEMFKIITNETDYSLHIGLKIGCVVSEIIDSYNDNSGRYRGGKRIQKAIVRTDIGLKGQISGYEIIDDRWDNDRDNISDHLYAGKKITAILLNVQKDRLTLDLSIKPSYLNRSESWWIRNRYQSPAMQWFQQSELLLANQKPPSRYLPFRTQTSSTSADLTLYDRYFNEDVALNAYDKAEALSATGKPVTAEVVLSAETVVPIAEPTVAPATKMSAKRSRFRNIHHPQFANVDYKEAEARLLRDGRGAGDIIFRPSSKGMDHLAITWAFTDNTFKHFDIEEKGKVNTNDVGKELYIREGNYGHEHEPYSDLDEIYSRFVEPMNDFVKIMMRSRYFINGTPEQVESQMRADVDRLPQRIPYYVRLEPGKPGFFALTWMSLNSNSSQPVKKELVVVTPDGYRMKGKCFPTPDQLIKFFKDALSAIQTQQPKPQIKEKLPNQETRQRPSRFHDDPTRSAPVNPSYPTYDYQSAQYNQPPVPSHGIYFGGYRRG